MIAYPAVGGVGGLDGDGFRTGIGTIVRVSRPAHLLIVSRS